MSGVFIWGWDGTDWQKVLTDVGGRLQVDVVAAPAFRSHCYGHDGGNWRTLLVGRPANAFATPAYALETMGFLMGFDGIDWNMVRVDATGHLQIDVLSNVFPADYPLPAAQIAALQAVTVGNFPATYPLSAAQVATLQQVTEQGTPSVHLYGYDGSNWQTLRVESNVLQNLRVKLYDGADGIDSDLIDSNIFVSGERALLVRAQVCGYNLEPFHQRRTDSDALAAVTRELCQMNIALLYGYNGSTFDRLRTESSTEFNLRTRLYGGATAVEVSAPADTLPLTIWSLTTKSVLYGFYGETYRRIRAFTTAVDGTGTIHTALLTVGLLHGFNGSTWDRLRTYGTGILKVGRAEIDSTTVRKTVAGGVVAGAHNLYWISCSPDSPGAEFELTDAIAGGGAVVFDHFDPDKHSEVINLDPPIKFATGIWIEKFDHIHSLTFCYV